MDKFKNLLYTSCLCVMACARVGTPQGGDKDVQAPILLKSTPENYQTNFQAKSVRFEFDEFVQLKNINNVLVVSPPLKEQPEIKLKGKSVIMVMPDSLAKNTTYVFDFGDGIADLNEGNVFNHSYVFSTGNQIDSLEIKGKVIDALSKKALENVSVFVYENYVDSLPTKGRPNFFARTNDKGEFTVSHLKPNTYGLVVVADENKNLQFDPVTEKIGFLNNPVYLQQDSTVQVEPLYVFKENKEAIKIANRKRERATKYKIELNKTTKNISVTTPQKQEVGELYFKVAEQGDSVLVYTQKEPADSLVLILHENEEAKDTTVLFINSRGKQKDPAPIAMVKSLPRIGTFQDFKVSFNQPVFLKNTDSITLLVDSAMVQADYTMSAGNPFELNVHATWQAGSTYILNVHSGAMQTRLGAPNDSLGVQFKVEKEDFFGVLILNIKTEYEGAYVLELKNEKGDLIKKETFTEGKVLTFQNLFPGKYTCTIVEDVDKNGEWTTGDFEMKRQPERVHILTQEVKIRSNWDLKLDWQLTKE